MKQWRKRMDGKDISWIKSFHHSLPLVVRVVLRPHPIHANSKPASLTRLGYLWTIILLEPTCCWRMRLILHGTIIQSMYTMMGFSCVDGSRMVAQLIELWVCLLSLSLSHFTCTFIQCVQSWLLCCVLQATWTLINTNKIQNISTQSFV